MEHVYLVGEINSCMQLSNRGINAMKDVLYNFQKKR